VVKRFESAKIRATTTGMGSLFMTHLLKGDDASITSPGDVASKTLSEIPDRELKIALLNHGVYAVHGGGSLSAAHDDATLAGVLAAFEAAALELKKII